MLKWIKIVALVLLVLVGGLLLYATTRPGTLRVQRSTLVQAPADKIFPLINDFHQWASWSPYEHLDPAMIRTYSGAPSGVGAAYDWNGNNDVGQGRMEITRTSPPNEITIKVDFSRPVEGHDTAVFTLAPSDSSTEVTWTMEGATPFIGKVMGIFVNMDTMIGGDFETGLANLAREAEK